MIALIYATWTLRSGVRLAVDTPTYSRWADALIALGFNPAAYLRAQSFVAPPILYLLWITVVAVMKAMLGGSWMNGIVSLNVIAVSAGAAATIASIRRVTTSGASMMLATGLFMVSADLLIFVPYVLSDVIFWGLSTAVLVCGVALASAGPDDRRPVARTLAIGSVLLAIAIVFRPVSLPLAAFWCVAIAARCGGALIDRFATPLLVVALGLALLAILADAYVMANPASWPFGSYPAMLTLVRDEYRIGMFVHQSSPPMLVTPAADFLGFVRITLEKLLFFITPWLPHYSRAHTVANLLFFLPAYGLAVAAISNLRRLTSSQQRAVFVLALFVLFVAVFHSMLLIDSDHRYRLPLLPAVIMLAAIGLESVRRPRTLASTVRTK